MHGRLYKIFDESQAKNPYESSELEVKVYLNMIFNYFYSSIAYGIYIVN